MHLQDIQTMYEYNYWANKRMLSVIEPLPPDQFVKDIGVSHGGIRGTLVHIMGGEEIWVKRWKGEQAISMAKADMFPTFESVLNRWEMVEMEVMGFCHMLKTDDDILKIISYKDMKGNSYSQQLYQLMQHLINHSTYHRGQVVSMLRQIDVKPIGTDMVVFFREQK